MSTTVQESQLVAQALSDARDERRLGQRAIYERYADEVFSLLRRLVRERSSAEDLLQETFLRAFERLEQHDPDRSLRGWIHRIARNAALDHLHAAAKAARMAELEASAPAPPAAAAAQESVDEAQAALEALNPEDRALLLARHGTGLKLTELAVTLSCTERTVRNRLRRAADRWVAAILDRRTS